jgi:nucleotide-binding universal stress UspA family protein
MTCLQQSGKYRSEALLESILGFIDFSDATDAVVKTSADLAGVFKAKLILVHVATPEADYEGSEKRTDVSRHGIAGEMHHYLDSLHKIEGDLKDAGIDATALLVRGTSARGNPIPKILQEVKRVKPNLIVVGSHGHGLLRNVLLGSVSSALIRKATCPVLVIPARNRSLRRK